MNENLESDLDYDPDDPSAIYKPVNGLAILSILLALFSLLTIAFQSMVILNMIAAVVAMISIRQIVREPRYVGLKVAQTALFLTILAGTISLGYSWGRSAYLNGTAKAFSKTLMQLIMERRYGEAFEYSIDPMRRQPEGTDLTSYYNNSSIATPGKVPPMGEILTWLATPPLSIIEEDNHQGELRFVGFDQYKLNDHTWTPIACIYKYEPASPDLEASTFQVVMMRRIFEPPIGVSWRFFKFEVIAGPQAERGVQTINAPPPAMDPEGDGASKK